MKRAFLILCLNCLFVIPAFLSAQAENEAGSTYMGLSPEVLDSLKGNKAGEPSLQQILDSLGYNVNVQTDKLPTEVWVAIVGQYSEVMMAEVAGYAPHTSSGWYGHGVPADTHVIFRGADEPGDTAFFTITGCDSNGLFIAPSAGLKSPCYVYYTEQSLNPDHYDHAWVFCSKKRPNEFIVAWEDYDGGGDEDHNDLVLLYRLPNRPPVLSVPNDTSFFRCQPETICFSNISAYDPDYCGDTATITKIQGPGTYSAGRCCFLPASVDSTYRFIFVATDWFGATDTDTVLITVDISKPVLSCSGDELTCDSLLASATVTSNPSVGVTYLWTPAPVSGQGTATARYNTPGTKKVVVTITATGCKDSCNAEITQNVTKPTLTCAGDELTCDSTLASADVTSNPSVGVSYLWTPAPVSGQGTAHARYNTPGTKKVVVTITATGCKDSCNAEITQNVTKPTLTCAGDELTCDSLLASATVTSNPSVGVTYLWTPAPVSGQGTATARYNTPGTKKVVVTITATGCKDSCNAEITQNVTKPTLTCAGDELTCDSTLASADVTSNPSVGVSYLWTPAPVSGQGTATARYNTPGTKKVVVTITATGCKDSCNAEITQNVTKPTLTCAGDELTCDSTQASATVTSNPSVGVTYLWTPAPVSGQGTATARYNTPGTKKVVVIITATGCKDSCNAIITQNVTKPVLSCAGDELTCDSTQASATVTSDPSVGVTYLWTPAPVSGQGTAHARYNTPGDKWVVVTITATGCKDSCNAIITQNVTKPTLTCAGDELTCDSLLASADVTSNPSTGVTYLWTPTPTSGQGTAHARYNTSGTKWVVVTITATGCKDSCSAVITQNVTKPILSCTGDELTCDSTLASADVTSNPSTGVTYLWTPTPTSGQGTATARYNAPGDKWVVVTITATGCKDSCSAVITQNVTKPILSCTGDELTCDSTLASADVTSNPSTGVTYLWTPTPTSGQGTAHARYNTSGTKWVVVTITATGCKDSCSAVITQNVTKPILSCTGDELTCDSLLASATVTSDPSVGVTYLWTPAPVSGQGTATARYNAPGDKWVVVTITATGCKDSCKAVITQNITKPTLTCAGDELTCDSLLASATVTSNPSVGVTYLWTPAPVSGQGTATARYNAPGDKWVVVTITATGCKDSCKAVITQNITKPTLTCAGDELTCDSTQASATVTSNPSVGVTYLWTPAPVSGQGTATARYNAPGDKWVVVTITATGCKDSCNAIITQNVTKPVLSCTGDELTCDSTQASAMVTSNPSVGVTYLWTPAPVSGQGTATARYNTPGTKKVVVTITATGCKDSCNAEITQNVTKPTLTCAGDELTCDSLLASATVTSDPSVGVTYLWTPAPVSGQGTATARYNTPGDKWVVVTITATGCKDSCKAVITQNGTKPVLSCAGDELTCDSLLASATVTSDPSVGVTYLWTPAPVSGQGTATARYDTPGTKKVVVTITATGCKDSCNAIITQNVTKPVLSCAGDELTCDSTQASATVTSNPSVGVTYLWTPAPVSGQGTATARYNTPGDKWVVVTITATGCKDSCKAVITQNGTKPVLSCAGDELTCDSLLASATVTSDPSVGVTYLWTPAPVSGQGTSTARYDTPGDKWVVVTITATGCKDSCKAVITQNITKPTLTCAGDELTCDSLLASATVTSDPSVGVTYLWTPAPVSGQGTATARYNAPGDKWVVVTITATGCKDSCKAVITQNITKPTLTCSGDELTCDSLLASATVTSDPSVGVTYLWTPVPVSGQGTATARYNAPGDKWVVVTITATGCKDSCKAVITQNGTKPVLSCAGDELTCDSLLASATVTSDPSVGVTYLWTPAPVSGQGTATARYNTPGDKWVVVTITATGCKDSCKAVITQNGTKPVLSCSGDELTCDSLLASATVTSDPSVGVTYLWTPAPVSGQGTATARYNAPGDKWVVVTITATGCKDSCKAVITQNITKPTLTCAGDELTCDSLLASATVTSNPSVGVTYLWTPAPVSGQGTATARYNAPGDKWVVVTITATGCKDSCKAVITQNITKPTLTCAGDELTCDSTQASATVTSNPSVGVTYLWTPAPVSGQGTATARYNAPGDKWVVVTITATGCKDSCKAVITQNITKPTLTCAGDELTCDSLLASATVTSNPSVGVTYLWTPAPVSGQGTATARYDTPGDKWVVVTITATGCKDSCKAVITQNGTKPVLSCSGDELTCDSTLASADVTSNPSTGVTYLWTPTPTSGQGTATARYNTPGTKKVVVIITATGCKDSCNAIITQNVTKPTLTCAGDELTCDSLLASATVTSDPSVGVTYLWTPAPVSGQGTATARYNTPGDKWVVVTITATGCKDSCKAVITQNGTKPVLSCAGDELTCDSLLASATVTSDPSVGVTYLWTPAPVSGQGTAIARYNTPGDKWVVVTITATGCKDSCKAVITQNDTKPVLSCAGDELTCDSLLASATVTSDPSVGVTYLWTPAPVSGQGTATARYNTPGDKWVVVTITATGCKDSCKAVITQDIRPPIITCPDSMRVHCGHFSSGTFTVNHSEGDSIVQIQAWVTPADTGIRNLTVYGGTGITPTSGHVEFDANCSYPGVYSIYLEPTDKCGLKDTCCFQVRATNLPPQIVCPSDTSADVEHFISSNFTASDPEGLLDTVYVASVSPIPDSMPYIVGNHVEWGITSGDVGYIYTITLIVTDDCGATDQCSSQVTVGEITRRNQVIIPNKVYERFGYAHWVYPDTGIYLDDACEPYNGINPGDFFEIPIILNEPLVAIGGFELQVDFDYIDLTFYGAEPGKLLSYRNTVPGVPQPTFWSWEYFSYRLCPCTVSGCLKYKILLYGQADLPDGPYRRGYSLGKPGDNDSTYWAVDSAAYHRKPDSEHQTAWWDTVEVGASLVWLRFQVANNELLRDLKLPIVFEWEHKLNDTWPYHIILDWDCAENTMSNRYGNLLYVSKDTMQYDPHVCPNLPSDQRILDFIDGGVHICSPCTAFTCVRGDINMDKVPNTVADAVMFARYFVYGINVFQLDRDEQVCATDVNADGRTLMLSDLIYLIRVAQNDAVPYPKLGPSSDVVNVIVSDGKITVECASAIGGLLFKFDGNVTPTLLNTNMDLLSNESNVLVWSSAGNSIAGASELLNTSGAKLVSVMAVDREGRDLATTITTKLAPTAFALHPAYPNPFNPNTNLSFTLPNATAYSMNIYNVAGQLVRSYEGMGNVGLNVITWDGKDNAGNAVSSGIYFYKLSAGNFTATNKMVMLK